MMSLAERLKAKKEEGNVQAQNQPSLLQTKEAKNWMEATAITLKPIEELASITNTVSSIPTIPKEKAVSLDDIMDMPVDAGVLSDAKIAVEDIVPRIQKLNALSDADLGKEMKLLKDALMANPAAVELMLPTDIGQMVKALRRITGEAIVQAELSKKKPKKEKEPDLSKAKVSLDIFDEL